MLSLLHAVCLKVRDFCIFIYNVHLTLTSHFIYVHFIYLFVCMDVTKIKILIFSNVTFIVVRSVLIYLY